MAIYLSIQKLDENENMVIYRFGPSEKRFEKLEINKKSQESKRLTPFKFKSNYYYVISVAKILNTQKNDPRGQYPNHLIYVS